MPRIISPISSGGGGGGGYVPAVPSQNMGGTALGQGIASAGDSFSQMLMRLVRDRQDERLENRKIDLAEMIAKLNNQSAENVANISATAQKDIADTTTKGGIRQSELAKEAQVETTKMTVDAQLADSLARNTLAAQELDLQRQKMGWERTAPFEVAILQNYMQTMSNALATQAMKANEQGKLELIAKSQAFKDGNAILEEAKTKFAPGLLSIAGSAGQGDLNEYVRSNLATFNSRLQAIDGLESGDRNALQKAIGNEMKLAVTNPSLLDEKAGLPGFRERVSKLIPSYVDAWESENGVQNVRLRSVVEKEALGQLEVLKKSGASPEEYDKIANNLKKVSGMMQTALPEWYRTEQGFAPRAPVGTGKQALVAQLRGMGKDDLANTYDQMFDDPMPQPAPGMDIPPSRNEWGPGFDAFRQFAPPVEAVPPSAMQAAPALAPEIAPNRFEPQMLPFDSPQSSRMDLLNALAAGGFA